MKPNVDLSKRCIICTIFQCVFFLFVAKSPHAAIQRRAAVAGTYICEGSCPQLDSFEAGCSASYAQPCSFRVAVQVTSRVKSALEETASESAVAGVLKQINESVFNPPGLYGFSPLVLDDLGNIVADGNTEINHAGFSLDQLFDSSKWYIVHGTEIMNQIKAVVGGSSSSKGWIEFPWYDGNLKEEPGFPQILLEKIAWLWHFTSFTDARSNATYYIGAGFQEQPLYRKADCDSQYSLLCTTHNIKAALGKTITYILQSVNSVEVSLRLTEITWGSYLTDEEAELEVFVFRYRNGSKGECVAFCHQPDVVGLNFSEIATASPDSHYRAHSGEDLHSLFSEAATAGGKWVKFVYVEGNSLQARVAMIVGIELEGQWYYVGASVPHVRQEMTLGPNCEVCSGEYGYPCTIQNVQSLVAFAEMELLTNKNETDVVSKIHYNPVFKMGPLYLFVVDLDTMNTLAHGGAPWFQGYTMAETFVMAMGVEAVDWAYYTFNLFKEQASKGRGWVSYDWSFSPENVLHKISYVMKIDQYGKNLILGAGFNRVPYPAVHPCSAQYGWSKCSEANVISIVGSISSMLLSAKLSSDVDKVLQQVTDQRFNLGDMSAVIHDDTGKVLAHGSDSGFVGLEISDYLLAQEIASITVTDYFSYLVDTGGEFSGKWSNVPWGKYGSNVQQIMMYSFQINVMVNTSEWKGDAGGNWFITSSFFNRPHPNICGSCPEHSSSSCIIDSQETSNISYCQCASYHDTILSFESKDDNCSLVPNSLMECELNAPFCSEDHWQYQVYDCDNQYRRRIRFSWKDDKICEGGLSLPENFDVSCDTVAFGSSLSICVHVFSISGMVAEALFIVFVVYHRKSVVIKTAQPFLCVTFCCGGLLLNLTPLLQIGPLEKWKCVSHYWCIHLFSSVLVVSLFIKVYRVYLVFMNRSFNRIKSTSFDAVWLLFRLVLFEVFILLGNQLNHSAQITSSQNQQNYATYTEYRCETQSDNRFLDFSVLAYKGGLLVLSCVLSYKARRVNSTFLDPVNILAAVYNCAVVVFFAILINYLFAVEKHIFVVMESASIWWATCISTILMLFPKICHILKDGNKNVHPTSQIQQRRDPPPPNPSSRFRSQVNRSSLRGGRSSKYYSTNTSYGNDFYSFDAYETGMTNARTGMTNAARTQTHRDEEKGEGSVSAKGAPKKKSFSKIPKDSDFLKLEPNLVQKSEKKLVVF